MKLNLKIVLVCLSAREVVGILLMLHTEIFEACVYLMMLEIFEEIHLHVTSRSEMPKAFDTALHLCNHCCVEALGFRWICMMQQQ